MSDETLFEEVTRQAHEIAERINMPGEEHVYFPTFKGSPLDGFTDYRDKGFAARVNNYHVEILVKDISKQTGQTWVPLTPQTLVDEAAKDGHVRETLYYYWAPIRGAIFKKGYAIPSPEVVKRDDKPAYDGEKVTAKISVRDLGATLKSAKMLSDPIPRILKNSICFDVDGAASVRSLWYHDRGALGAYADWPLCRSYDGVAAFELVEVDSESTHRSAKAEHEPSSERSRKQEKLPIKRIKSFWKN